jgi:ABC-2 type transport system permease protein
MFEWAPRGLSLVVVPVITMRLLAEEKRSGTLEMLITLPVKDHEVILGKFFGAWGLVLVLILATTLYPIMMFGGFPWHLGALDSGPVISGYLGIVLYSAAAVSIGLLISALTESQVIAFFVTFVLLFALHFIGYAADQIKMEAAQRGLLRELRHAPRAVLARPPQHARHRLLRQHHRRLFLMAAFRALERRKWA